MLLAVAIAAFLAGYWLLPPKVMTSILIGLFAVLSILIEPLLELAVTLVFEE
jgi:hypothetical protein